MSGAPGPDQPKDAGATGLTAYSEPGDPVSGPPLTVLAGSVSEPPAAYSPTPAADDPVVGWFEAWEAVPAGAAPASPWNSPWL